VRGGVLAIGVVSVRSFSLGLLAPLLVLLMTSPEVRADALLAGEEALARPIPAGLDQVLDASPDAWRSPGLEVYRWERFPDIIVIDMVDFPSQDRMFTRLAYFAEKKGFRGRLLTNARLAGRHGWNAHDYGPDALAGFYNAASRLAFPLNPEENALKSLALREGILLPNGERVASGRGGVLSISRSSSTIERRYLLTHESFHGIFFSSAE
jgi:hypothetical protein